MIKKTLRDEYKPKYGRFFLAVEAPGDEDEEEDLGSTEVEPDTGEDTPTDVPPAVDVTTEEEPPTEVEPDVTVGEDPPAPERTNVKNVAINPDNRRRVDYADVPDDDTGADPVDTGDDTMVGDDQGMGEPVAEPDGVGDTPPEDTTDYALGDDPEVGTDPPPTETDGEDDTTDYTDTGAGTNDDASMDDTGTPEGGEGTTDSNEVTVGEDPPDDTDYTDTGVDDGGTDAGDDGTGDTDDTSGTDSSSDDTDGEKKPPGVDQNSIRLYVLFKEFINLRSSVEDYIHKTEGCISDDPTTNAILKTATAKFREVHDLLTDYMTMKYEVCTYVQNLLFYQRIIATVNFILDMMDQIPDSDKKKIQKS